jgi:TorA maturation chaperone TorD
VSKLSTDLQLELGKMCHALYIMFHQKPTQEQIDSLKDSGVFSAYCSNHESLLIKDAIGYLNKVSIKSGKADLPAIKNDFADLFVGPFELKAHPWGSVYLHVDKEVFGESTIEVHQYYKMYGVDLDTGVNEPADHIGLMFAFLSYLFSKMLDASYGEDEIDIWIEAIRKFLTDHMLTWSSVFFNLVQENAETPYYKNVALLADGVLEDIAKLTNAEFKKVDTVDTIVDCIRR